MAHFSKEVIELQVADIDLLRAAYPEADELVIDSSTIDDIDALRDWVLDANPPPTKIPSTLSCVLFVRLDTDGPEKVVLQLNIEYDLATEDGAKLYPCKPPKVQLRQPAWMTKAAVAKIFSNMPDDFDTIMYIVEHIRDEATAHYKSMARQQTAVPQTPLHQAELVRAWFYFPSLSTREKRDDLVAHAPSFGLTGFVLAGKPGILCLEGQPHKIDTYMKFIKTESWGDIPSHHKKVSERFRETGKDVHRHFVDMREITDLLGEKRGERGNRSDMKALEAWLIDKDLGQAFTHVLM